MRTSSRTTNTVNNIAVNLVLYCFTYIAVFISRTYFVKYLGNEYLSLNGLFTNIITIVSFSELGIGSASIYCLYKPIAENNYSKIHSYLHYFKKLYYVVIFVSLIIAALVIPILPSIIDTGSIMIPFNQIVLFYCLFVVNTVATYFFISSKLLLIADQKNYIANTIQQTIHLCQSVFQILYIVITKDFVGFLIIQIFATILSNIAIHFYVKRKYSIVFQSELKSIGSKERKQLTSNIGSIFFYKIGSVVMNGSDNIIISSFVKTSFVGICSNYLLIINAINSLLMQCFNAIGASIGNHVVLANKEEQENVFCQLNFMCVLAFSFASICLFTLINPLIELWLGCEYLLDFKTVVSLILVFFITGINQIPSLYRTSIGLFKNARFFPLLASIVNIALSISFAKIFGLWGIFLSTVIVRLIFFTCVDSVLVYKYGFSKSPIRYFINLIRDIIYLIIGCYIVNYIFYLIYTSTVKSFIIASVFCACIAFVTLIILYSKTREFSNILQRIALMRR